MKATFFLASLFAALVVALPTAASESDELSLSLDEDEEVAYHYATVEKRAGCRKGREISTINVTGGVSREDPNIVCFFTYVLTLFCKRLK
jgi:hypothetical protein